MGFDFEKYERKQKEVMMKLHQETQKIKALLILANEQSFLNDDYNYNNHQSHYSNNSSKLQDFCKMEVA